MTNNAMRYDRYGRPEAVLAPTENGHTGLGHHHTGFGHHANGEFDFGSPRLDLHQDPYSGAAVPPPFASPPCPKFTFTTLPLSFFTYTLNFFESDWI